MVGRPAGPRRRRVWTGQCLGDNRRAAANRRGGGRETAGGTGGGNKREGPWPTGSGFPRAAGFGWGRTGCHAATSPLECTRGQVAVISRRSVLGTTDSGPRGLGETADPLGPSSVCMFDGSMRIAWRALRPARLPAPPPSFRGGVGGTPHGKPLHLSSGWGLPHLPQAKRRNAAHPSSRVATVAAVDPGSGITMGDGQYSRRSVTLRALWKVSV